MAGYAPNAGQLTVQAFARLQVRRTQLTVTHLADAMHEANLLQASWANRGPNLWTVEQQEIALAPGVAQYDLPADTVEVEEVYVTTAPANDVGPDAGDDVVAGGASSFDRQLYAMGRTEYLDIPMKLQQGWPTSFWYQRGVAPKINLWPVPCANQTLYYWRTRNIGTVSAADGGKPEVPYLWLDAFVAGLAHRLARIYAPEMEGMRKQDAGDAWLLASEQDTEKTPMYLSPNTSRYWR